MPSAYCAGMDGAKHVLIVGAGGIGSTITDLLIPTLNIGNLAVELTVMDDDFVEQRNIGHQRFTPADIGKTKVAAIAEKFADSQNVKITGIAEKLTQAEQLENYDLVVIAVDNPQPRKLVHSTCDTWCDIRSTGDGFLLFTSNSPKQLVSSMTQDHPPASCQVPGAIESGHIQFGFALAAVHAVEWLLANLWHGGSVIDQRIYSASFGQLEFPMISESEQEVVQ